MKIQFLTNDEKLITEVNEFVNEWNSNSLHIITKTSGSTGNPKEIIHSKEFMKASALKTISALSLESEGTTVLCLSPMTIGGKMMIVRSILLKAKLIVVDVDGDPLRSINEKVDFMAMVPLQVRNTLTHIPGKLNQIDNLIIGGGQIQDSDIEKLASISVKSFQTFGMTETISHIALKRIDGSNSIYKAVEGASFNQEEGQLIINAPYIGIHKLKTNDRVQLINETSFKWLGRVDFVVNSGGVKLHPEEIEAKLSKILNASFFVHGLPDERLGEKLVLCIESNNLDLEKSCLVNILSKYERPKVIYYFAEFIKTQSGKINRVETINRRGNAERKVL